jgi:stage II sporulation protein D
VESTDTTLPPGSPRRVLRGPWLTAWLAAAFLGMLAVAPATASTQALVPACNGVNIRAGASTATRVVVTLGSSASLTSTGTVAGASWGTSCPTWKSGSRWYVITAINGRAVSSAYGVNVLYAATGVLSLAAVQPTAPPPIAPTTVPTTEPSTSASPSDGGPATPAPSTAPAPTPVVTPAGTSMVPACNGINLRTAPTTSGALVVRLGLASTLTVTGKVSGSAWSTWCPTAKAASTWWVVSEVNGRSVSLLYGRSVIYAASGILSLSTVTSAPPSSASPTSAPPTVEATSSPPPAATPAPATQAPATQAPVSPAPTTTPAPAGSSPTATDLVPACSAINIRAASTTSSSIVTTLGSAATVTVTGMVSGAAWSTWCPTAKAGAGWYVVSAINGASVRSLYGVPSVYAATGILTAPLTPVPPATGVVALSPTTTFYGRGYGHGVGLSQYGARGRALAGQSASEILAHYYQGTTIGTIAADAQIRVLVLDNFIPTAGAPLTIFGHGGSWTVQGISATFPAESILRLYPPTSADATWRMTVTDAIGTVIFVGTAPADARVAGTSDATTLQLVSKPSNFDRYRGDLRWLISGGQLDVINELPLETYLRGVVPAEMPTSWPLEARIAQTIAARSYAAYRLHPSTGTFDVYDDTRSQVYQGVYRESAGADAVIVATANQVLRSGTGLVNALFHSTGGGATENNENVFVSSTGQKVAGPVSYLRGSLDRDPSGASYDAAAPHATWQTATYSIAQLSAVFGADARTAVGTISALDLGNRGVSGRLISVTLIGSSGSRTVSGQVFVDVFNAHRQSGDPGLMSTLLSIAPIR